MCTRPKELFLPPEHICGEGRQWIRTPLTRFSAKDWALEFLWQYPRKWMKTLFPSVRGEEHMYNIKTDRHGVLQAMRVQVMLV